MRPSEPSTKHSLILMLYIDNTAMKLKKTEQAPLQYYQSWSKYFETSKVDMKPPPTVLNVVSWRKQNKRLFSTTIVVKIFWDFKGGYETPSHCSQCCELNFVYALSFFDFTTFRWTSPPTPSPSLEAIS